MALAKKPFVVLDAELLSSSVWSEAAHVRLVWITLLILCDTDGYVGAALPGIATAAGVSLEQASEAVDRLQQPDQYSRTRTNEGRRLAPSERGWQVLNFREHLDRLSSERVKARERVRRHRERKAMKRDRADGNVTVRSENREQGEGNREENVGTYLPPPDVRAETALRTERWSQERSLLAVVGQIAERENRDVPEVMREVTAYKKRDGVVVNGRVNPALLSDERLEKSLEDAMAWLEELQKNAPR